MLLTSPNSRNASRCGLKLRSPTSESSYPDLKVVREEADKVVFVVPDLKLGTNDCRGWIRRSLFLKLGLPEGYFYQFRLAFENTQAKGSFKIMSDDVADAVGCDIIVPESSIKPGLKKQSVLKTFFGSDVRSVSWRRSFWVSGRFLGRLRFESSYTVLQHAPVDAIATEIVPQAREKIELLKAAWAERNHQALVEMIGSSVRCDDSEEEEFQRIIEATLLADGSGELTRHPYIHRQLDRLLARWAYKLMTGGGIDLPAFALADDGILYLRRRQSHVRRRLDAAGQSHHLKHFGAESVRSLSGSHERGSPCP